MRLTPLLLVVLMSCTPHPYHTGAVSHLDSTAYDQLEQARARIELATAELKDAHAGIYFTTPSLRRLMEAYRYAHEQWGRYREPQASRPNPARLNLALKRLKAEMALFDKDRTLPQ